MKRHRERRPSSSQGKRPSGRTNPAHSLILDFKLPEPGDNTFLPFKPLCYGSLGELTYQLARGLEGTCLENHVHGKEGAAMGSLG